MSLFIGLCLSAFQQFTGINGVIFDSNNIFKDGKEGIDADKAARIGTFFIGVAGFLGTALSLITAKHFGRKTLILFGEFELWINLAFLGVCWVYKWTTLQILATNILNYL